MTLKIFCEDGSTQVVNLDKSFVLDRINDRNNISYLLSFQDCNRKAMTTAQSIVGEENYMYHTLNGYDDVTMDIRNTH